MIRQIGQREREMVNDEQNDELYVREKSQEAGQE